MHGAETGVCERQQLLFDTGNKKAGPRCSIASLLYSQSPKFVWIAAAKVTAQTSKRQHFFSLK